MFDTHSTPTHIDPYGGSTWALSIWQDHATEQTFESRPVPADVRHTCERVFDCEASDSLAALAAAESWEEVLTLSADPTQRLPHMLATDPAPRTNVRVSERPNRGRITVTRADGSTTTLAADGSPVTATGGSSKRAAAAAVRTERQRARALAAGEVLATPTVAAPRYVMVDGEPVAYVNDDGSIG